MAENNNRQQLLAYVDEVIAATSAGAILWKAVNPTTFVWETSTPRNARLSFQRVERVTGTVNVMVGGRPRPQQQKLTYYLFQGFDLSGPSATPVVNIESAEDGDLNRRFGTLFELIKTGLSERSLKFLRDILPK